jgi:hypothetical protein
LYNKEGEEQGGDEFHDAIFALEGIKSSTKVADAKKKMKVALRAINTAFWGGDIPKMHGIHQIMGRLLKTLPYFFL